MGETQTVQNQFSKGLRDGVPIGLGYLSVSVTFGVMAVAAGLPVWAAVLISMTNLTSAGQFAGLSLMTSGAPLFEMALTQFVVNIRYSLMSLSLSQKLSGSIRTIDRIFLSFFNTDEIFAVASMQEGALGRRYLCGLACIPYLGWSGGTLLGAVAASLLPERVASAFGIAIYGMFLAIIVPPAKHNRAVLGVILLAVVLSSLFEWLPMLGGVSSGFAMILCAVAASALGALLHPVEDGGETCEEGGAVS
ncbi:MAG TPA: AzlC family ABC transporter permease [Candidatus Fimivicinus intestinavium]|nr:AzlC family ABC transporter permease [Candidatus Fimivicinus intestinavium]